MNLYHAVAKKKSWGTFTILFATQYRQNQHFHNDIITILYILSMSSIPQLMPYGYRNKENWARISLAYLVALTFCESYQCIESQEKEKADLAKQGE